MAILNHAAFCQPDDPSISLWRYMDLSKFAALLQRRALVFSRADKLGDPFEGSMPVPNTIVPEAITLFRQSSANPAALAGISDGELEILLGSLSRIRQQNIKQTYISCWHMNQSESAGMWKLYSKSSDAVCIQTDYATLAKCLPTECYMGIIRYIDFKTELIDTRYNFTPFLVKRLSFSHEKEARALHFVGDPRRGANSPVIKEFPIDLAQLIKTVFVSPESPDWFRDVVQQLVEKYDLAVQVNKSELTAIPLY